MSESEQARSTSSPAEGDAAKPGADPSMEDILASIRRILAEEEVAPPTLAPPPPPAAGSSVLQLDASMLVGEPLVAPDPPSALTVPAHAAPPPAAMPAPAPTAAPLPTPTLVAPETADAAASSVGSLVRTLAAERTTQVYAGGPTIEDIVRSELRPLLKQWLDVHLPPLVERLVRVELERVVGRAVP